MMESADRSARARSFDAWAADYDHYRPSYPPALFDTIAGRFRLSKHAHVVDLGAGTGKAALAMAGRGWRVTAVEPGEPMLAVLRQQAAEAGLDVATVQATAEETTLPASSFELATAAEAYHWFNAPQALREVGRLLLPGGGLACFWNVRDVDASPLLAEYGRLGAIVGAEDADLRRPGPREATRTEILASQAFEEPAFKQVCHEVTMTGKDFVGLAFTTSHVRTASPRAQAEFRSELNAVLRRHGIRPATRFRVPYVVDCWLARRRRVPNNEQPDAPKLA